MRLQSSCRSNRLRKSKQSFELADDVKMRSFIDCDSFISLSLERN